MPIILQTWEVSEIDWKVNLSFPHSAKYWVCSKLNKSVYACSYQEHLDVVIRILKYLKGSLERGIFFEKGEPCEIEAYTDADWACSVIDRRSTSGYCFYIWGNLETWRSKKQNIVVRSSAKA